MKVLVLDTNILLLRLRVSNNWQLLKERYSFGNPSVVLAISSVTIGELLSISKRNKWGNRKLEILETLLHEFLIIPIDSNRLYETYAEIDTFGQGKSNHPTNFSARNMGKNDLWIAATASLLNAQLLTMDKDFTHLDKVFLDLEVIEL
jgi:predicted nucleic acid-binding protein